MALPATVIREDARLEQAGEDLAELRWHWTLDETNPKRVPMREYAKSVGRDVKAIHLHAHAWALYLADGSVNTPGEAIERTRLGETKAVAAGAVAKARGASVPTVSRNYRAETGRVLAKAVDAAEKNGTSLEDEAQKAADRIVKAEKTEKAANAKRRSRRSLRFVAVDKNLATARRALAEALETTPYVEWKDDELELLRDSVAKVRAAVKMVEVSLGDDASGTDWDAELAKLSGGS